MAAISKPSLAVYRSLIGQAPRESNLAYIWMLFAAVLSGGISLCSARSLSGALAGGLTGQGDSLAGTIFMRPAQILLAIPILVLLAGVAQATARALGGKGSYQQLVYLVAAIQAPLMLISTVVAIIPMLGPALSVLITIYSYILVLVAVEAVNDFGWGKTIVSSSVGVASSAMLTTVTAIFILALIGPGVGNAFSIINNSVVSALGP
jgi:hypothetical protein